MGNFCLTISSISFAITIFIMAFSCVMMFIKKYFMKNGTLSNSEILLFSVPIAIVPVFIENTYPNFVNILLAIGQSEYVRATSVGLVVITYTLFLFTIVYPTLRGLGLRKNKDKTNPQKDR